MLLKNGKVLIQINEDLKFKDLDIKISGNIISDVGENLDCDESTKVLDLHGDFVLPGMINSHYHSYTNILKGTSWGEPLELWSNDTVALGGILEGDDHQLSTLLGAAEMIKMGVTTCIDHIPHLKFAETIGKSYIDSGFKAALAPMVHNIQDREILHGINKYKNSSNPFLSKEEYLDFYESYISKFHNKVNEVTKVVLGINSPQRVDDKLLEAVSSLVKKYDLNIHSHFFETKWQKISADDGFLSPLQRLNTYDLLNKKTSLAHSIWVDDIDLNLITENDVSVISNPTSNLFLGSGKFPLEKYMTRNINIALGSDGLNCGTNHNMLEILRLFLLIQRIDSTNYKNWPNPKQSYDFITRNAGKILNFKTPVGSIQKNYSADIVIVDKSNFIEILEDSLLNQLILNTSTLKPKHVLVNGKFLMKDKKLTTIDESLLRKEIKKRTPSLKDSMIGAIEKSSQEKKEFKNVFNSIFNNQN